MIGRKADRFLLVSFCADQLVHLAFIVIIASLWMRFNSWAEFSWVTDNAKWLALAVALLVARSLRIFGTLANFRGIK